MSGTNRNPVVTTNAYGSGYTVQWNLCDGSVATGDSIPLDLINCDTEGSNMMLTDSLGNVVYEEKISLKGFYTNVNPATKNADFQIYPNPVNDILNIVFGESDYKHIQIEVLDLSGKMCNHFLKEFIYAG